MKGLGSTPGGSTREPGRQTSHREDPARSEKEPAGQVAQVAREVAASCVDAVPGWQREHVPSAVAPWAVENVPAAHGSHADAELALSPVE